MRGEHAGYEWHPSGPTFGPSPDLALSPLSSEDHTAELANGAPCLRVDGWRVHVELLLSVAKNQGCRLMCYDSSLCSGRRNTSASRLSRSVCPPVSQSRRH